jgi:hypothetical protein
LIGFAVALLSIGAMLPSTSQRAGIASVAAIHRGGDSVTADTGSPMALTGIADPSFAAVQSASVIVLSGPRETRPGGGTAPAGGD